MIVLLAMVIERVMAMVHDGDGCGAHGMLPVVAVLFLLWSYIRYQVWPSLPIVATCPTTHGICPMPSQHLVCAMNVFASLTIPSTWQALDRFVVIVGSV